jgi:multidrug resistance efflux pump
MKSNDQQLHLLSTLIQLEQNARRAETIAELGFIMVNETLRLVPYRQAIFWSLSPGGKITIRSVSATDSPASDSPFVHDLTTIIKTLCQSKLTESGRKLISVSEDSAGEKNRDLWQKWSLQHLLWCPLVPPDQNLAGGILLVRDSPWSEGESILVHRLADAYSHALWALEKNRIFSAQFFLSFLLKRSVRLLLITAIVAVLFIPVRLSVLAPVEIVPQNPAIICSPMDGVVKTIYVESNAKVVQGDLLFSLEDTGIRNEYDMSLKALEVVKARYMKAVQKSFQDQESRAQTLLLKAEVELKKATIDYAEEILQLSRIMATGNGIAVYSNREDWQGKPVTVGEKIMTIADPEMVEAEIMLQVSDAINLKPGADVKIFLNTEPDRPFRGVLKRADYEAGITPVGELAFRLRVSLEAKKVPRIGLRGSAKIYGKKVSLFYYLLRRPLTSVRLALGI